MGRHSLPRSPVRGDLASWPCCVLPHAWSGLPQCPGFKSHQPQMVPQSLPRALGSQMSTSPCSADTGRHPRLARSKLGRGLPPTGPSAPCAFLALEVPGLPCGARSSSHMLPSSRALPQVLALPSSSVPRLSPPPSLLPPEQPFSSRLDTCLRLPSWTQSPVGGNATGRAQKRRPGLATSSEPQSGSRGQQDRLPVRQAPGRGLQHVGPTSTGPKSSWITSRK